MRGAHPVQRSLRSGARSQPPREIADATFPVLFEPQSRGEKRMSGGPFANDRRSTFHVVDMLGSIYAKDFCYCRSYGKLGETSSPVAPHRGNGVPALPSRQRSRGLLHRKGEECGAGDVCACRTWNERRKITRARGNSRSPTWVGGRDHPHFFYLGPLPASDLNLRPTILNLRGLVICGSGGYHSTQSHGLASHVVGGARRAPDRDVRPPPSAIEQPEKRNRSWAAEAAREHAAEGLCTPVYLDECARAVPSCSSAPRRDCLRGVGTAAAGAVRDYQVERRWGHVGHLLPLGCRHALAGASTLRQAAVERNLRRRAPRASRSDVQATLREYQVSHEDSHGLKFLLRDPLVHPTALAHAERFVLDAHWIRNPPKHPHS